MGALVLTRAQQQNNRQDARLLEHTKLDVVMNTLAVGDMGDLLYCVAFHENQACQASSSCRHNSSALFRSVVTADISISVRAGVLTARVGLT